MARKPVNELGPFATQEAMWELIRRFKRPFNKREVFMNTWCTESQVRGYLTGLANAGILEKDTRTTPHLYSLVKDRGSEAPRVRRDGTEVTQGRGQEQMWRTMKALGDFTVFDLHLFASTDDQQVTLETAKSYCKALCRAGYLRRLEKDKYRLIRWTGPRPPMIQCIKQVYDPNLKEVVWTEGRNK